MVGSILPNSVFTKICFCFWAFPAGIRIHVWLFFTSMFLEPAGSVSNSEFSLVTKRVCLAISEGSSQSNYCLVKGKSAWQLSRRPLWGHQSQIMNALLWRNQTMPLRSRSLYEYMTLGLSLWVELTDILMRQLPRTATNVSLAFWVMSGLGLSFGKGLLRYGNMGCLSGHGSFFLGLWSQCHARWSTSLFIHRTMGPIFPNS